MLFFIYDSERYPQHVSSSKSQRDTSRFEIADILILVHH
jgi:hypothetical protein